jgi:hypothetical protein
MGAALRMKAALRAQQPHRKHADRSRHVDMLKNPAAQLPDISPASRFSQLFHDICFVLAIM